MCEDCGTLATTVCPHCDANLCPDCINDHIEDVHARYESEEP